MPFYAKPGKRLVRLEHHKHHFLASPGQTGEALHHVLSIWHYNILELDLDQGTASFHWGATDHIAGKTVRWLYERLHQEGTEAVIEHDPIGSLLNLSMPSARYLTGGAVGLPYAVVGMAGGPAMSAGTALIAGGPVINATAAWERRIVKRFFKGIERRLDGLCKLSLGHGSRCTQSVALRESLRTVRDDGLISAFLILSGIG